MDVGPIILLPLMEVMLVAAASVAAGRCPSDPTETLHPNAHILMCSHVYATGSIEADKEPAVMWDVHVYSARRILHLHTTSYNVAL